MTHAEIRRAIELAKTTKTELEGDTWVGDPDDVNDMALGFLAVVDVLREVVRDWDEDGHSPTNETFAKAAKIVGFVR